MVQDAMRVYDIPTQRGMPVSATNPLPTVVGAPAAANILDGYALFGATTGATTLVQVPAGRTWKGRIGASCAVGMAATNTTAGQAIAVFSVSGSGAVPSGNVFEVAALVGANAATATVGTAANNADDTELVVAAPAGNPVNIQIATTQTGTQTRVGAYAIGVLL